MKIKISITVLSILQILAFASSSTPPELYYYNLRSLDKASSPRYCEMVKINNINNGIPIVQKGVLFTYKNREASQVQIAGNFSQWKPVFMDRSLKGVWYYFLGEFKGTKEVKYKFCVQGNWISDPQNTQREDDGAGSYLSVVPSFYSGEGHQLTYRQLDSERIEFRIYHPGARHISLVGDFNHWNPENDLLQKKNNGVWRLVKRLPRGTYRYKYIIDGEWTPDTYNRASASDDNGEICSVITVK